MNSDNLFLKALTTKDLFTENGMPTHSTSGSYNVDLFFKMGAMRNSYTADYNDLIRIFQGAILENPEYAMKNLFYNRDIRGGQGERDTFRLLFKFVCMFYPELARKNIELIPHFGRWDDVIFACFGTDNMEEIAADFILHGIKSGDKLCAKWMPRENKKHRVYAEILMDYWDLTPRNYRKLLAGNTQVVESLMCRGEWGKIKYEHVPSRAMFKYRKAFFRNDEERFAKFIEDVKSGKKEIHSGTLFPHEIVSKMWSTHDKKEISVLEAQWDALPDFVPENISFIPVCDVSGSMHGTPMEVSVGLGIYLSQRNKGSFKDAFITFSANPKLQYLRGTLREKVTQLSGAEWGMNTNLEKVFKLILTKSLENNVPSEEMPKILIIISDMQFDQCVHNRNDSALEMISRMYEESGYTRPNIIFWNVRDSFGIPAKKDDVGISLVSGYSPSLMARVMDGDISPIRFMLDVILSERYARVEV